MLKKESVIVPEHKKIKKIYLCDICGIDLEDENESGYDRHEATIEYKEGSVYPESDDRDYYSFDVCMKCTRDKVFPLLESAFGVKARHSSESDIWD